MRYFFLLLILLLAAGPAVAQTSLIAARPDSLPVAQAAPDTVAAIHRLFADRRKTSHLLTGTLVGVVLGASIPATQPYYSPVVRVLSNLAVVTPFELIILLTNKKYSAKAEARALIALQAHQLSPKIKRRLKAHHFQPALGRK